MLLKNFLIDLQWLWVLESVTKNLNKIFLESFQTLSRTKGKACFVVTCKVWNIQSLILLLLWMQGFLQYQTVVKPRSIPLNWGKFRIISEHGLGFFFQLTGLSFAVLILNFAPAKVNELWGKKKVSSKIWLDRYRIFLISISLSVFGVEVKEKGHMFQFYLVCWSSSLIALYDMPSIAAWCGFRWIILKRSAAAQRRRSLHVNMLHHADVIY